MSKGYKKLLDISDRKRIELVRAFIMANLHLPLKASEVAQHFNYHTITLKRHFRMEYGVKLSRFVLDCKMVSAYTLLKELHHSVSSVSDDLGYKNISAFTHAFIRYHGYKPTDLQSPDTL